MIAAHSEMDPEVRQVTELLQQHFNEVDCYRYNSVSIRARIRDGKFRAMSQSEREALIEPILDQLPEEVHEQLILLLLLPASGPKSLTEKLLNKEFEHPEHSMF